MGTTHTCGERETARGISIPQVGGPAGARGNAPSAADSQSVRQSRHVYDRERGRARKGGREGEGRISGHVTSRGGRGGHRSILHNGVYIQVDGGVAVEGRGRAVESVRNKERVCDAEGIYNKRSDKGDQYRLRVVPATLAVR